MTDPSAPRPLRLRDLPLAVRLTLAVFLLSVGIGYLSALVQLHFQHATPGRILPTGDDVVKVFSGDRGPKPRSQVEILVEADEHLPWNGHGQMSAAFFAKSADWKSAIRSRAGGRGTSRRTTDPAAAEAEVRKERETERQALLEWVRGGANKADYEQDHFCLPDSLAGRPLTREFIVTGADGKPEEPRAVKIKTLITQRCVRCHTTEDSEDSKAAKYPLDSYERLKPHVSAAAQSTGMSLPSLAQTTHVHLLGFSVLYGMTGLILAFSSYPRAVRVFLAPLPLAAQVVDIAFWWLARLDDPYGPMFARAIVVSGGIVGMGLGLHILLGLWDLFGRTGRLILFVLALIGLAAAGYVAQTKVIPYLSTEGRQPAAEAGP
jgi:hypothetical protein